MAESTQNTPDRKSASDRLNSWKEIAAYLNRDVTTVQRWEKREGMPVQRHLHDRMGSVYAFRSELDTWAHSRQLRSPGDIGDEKIDKSVLDGRGDIPASAGVITGTRKRFRTLATVVAVGAALAITAFLWLRKAEYFWKNPVTGAKFQTVTEFEGEQLAVALSHSGQFVAFLSDRDGQMDVWVTQIGSGQFHNLTRASVSELVNPSVRTLGFSHDDSLITFWIRSKNHTDGSDINIWAIPTLGGEPKPYLEGVAEFDWSHDGTKLAYHTPGPGDPLFVTDGSRRAGGPPVFTAPSGQHSHFPLWAPDSAFLYFVEGSLPDKLDIWRIKKAGGKAEQITSQNVQITYPVFLDRRTLLYLAKDSDGAGPWLYSLDIERRVPHRLIPGLDRYTSLAGSADGRRVALTLASPKRSLWRLSISDSAVKASMPMQISLPTSSGFAPRLGSDYFLYLSASGSGESIWKVAKEVGTEVWGEPGARIFGAPAISPDQRSIAFSVEQHGQTVLYTMQADGTNARVVCDSLKLRGSLAWEPDGKTISTAADVQGIPRLFHVPIDGRTPSVFGQEYSVNPTWAPDGQFVVFSGADIGTTFPIKGLTGAGAPYSVPALTLTRGARHLAFLNGKRALVVLRGEIQHKDLWSIDLETGSERQLTNLPADFNVSDFDISSDGTEVIFERAEERSEVVLVDLARQ
jgi:Tol biopolymer transport system component